MVHSFINVVEHELAMAISFYLGSKLVNLKCYLIDDIIIETQLAVDHMRARSTSSR